jgi:DNA repair protein RecO (recombination protein O)
MKYSDSGIVISIKKYGEKSAILKVFSQNYGVYRGFVKHVSSKKNNAILQMGNLITFDYVARLEDSLGNFLSFDLAENNCSRFMLDKLRINCAKSVISMIDDYFLEREPFEFLYKNFVEFLQNLGDARIQNQQIIANYIKLELMILESLGYGIDFSCCVVTNSRVNLAFVSPKSAHAVSMEAGEKYSHKLLKLPNFLLEENFENIEDNHLIDGLKLSGFFLKKFLFIDDFDKGKQQNSFYRNNIIKGLQISQ